MLATAALRGLVGIADGKRRCCQRRFGAPTPGSGPLRLALMGTTPLQLCRRGKPRLMIRWRGYAASKLSQLIRQLIPGQRLRRWGWLVIRISLPRLRVLSNPLRRVMLGRETLDCFRFAIGPQNIDTPARPGIFPRHESWSLLGHRTNMRPC
jgi:hypothetical protein